MAECPVYKEICNFASKSIFPTKKENLKQLLNKKYEKIFGNGRCPLRGNRFHKL